MEEEEKKKRKNPSRSNNEYLKDPPSNFLYWDGRIIWYVRPLKNLSRRKEGYPTKLIDIIMDPNN